MTSKPKTRTMEGVLFTRDDYGDWRGVAHGHEVVLRCCSGSTVATRWVVIPAKVAAPTLLDGEILGTWPKLAEAAKWAVRNCLKRSRQL